MRKRRPPNQRVEVFKYITMRGEDDCWLWTGALVGRDSRPYFSVKGRKLLAYRIVYELTTGKTLSSDILIRHTCDNRMCCNPKHLIEGSHTQNMNDMKERERHGLPHNTVRKIKRLILKNIPYTAIAEMFGCSPSLVGDIANMRVYAHVQLEDGRFNDPLHREDVLEKEKQE